MDRTAERRRATCCRHLHDTMHSRMDRPPDVKTRRPRFLLPFGQWVTDVVEAVIFSFFTIIPETGSNQPLFLESWQRAEVLLVFCTKEPSVLQMLPFTSKVLASPAINSGLKCMRSFTYIISLSAGLLKHWSEDWRAGNIHCNWGPQETFF